MFRAPAGDDGPWKWVLRRASSETESRQVFDQAEAAGWASGSVSHAQSEQHNAEESLLE